MRSTSAAAFRDGDGWTRGAGRAATAIDGTPLEAVMEIARLAWRLEESCAVWRLGFWSGVRTGER